MVAPADFHLPEINFGGDAVTEAGYAAGCLTRNSRDATVEDISAVLHGAL